MTFERRCRSLGNLIHSIKRFPVELERGGTADNSADCVVLLRRGASG